MNPESYPSFNIISTGVDGTQVAVLSTDDWVDLVNTIAAQGAVEWYMAPTAKTLFNATGKGYFPHGITIGKTITIHESAKGNLDLLAHEYGHALGLQHTKTLDPDVMNPVAWLRMGDENDLRVKFKQNFPDYTFIAATPSPLVVVGLLGVAYALTRSL